MPNEIEVALIGYGFAGKTFHAPLIASIEGLRLHTVVSSDAAKVQVDFPQARVVATLDEAPNTLHASQASAALTAGKHVVVDKPFTVTPAEAEAVIADAEKNQRLLSVFHNRRWDAAFLTVQGLLADGTLGELVHFESHFDRYRPRVRDRWRERTGPGSGAWFDLGPHLVDQALRLFGPPQAIFVDAAAQRDGASTDDYFHALLRYPTHRVVLHASALVASENRRFTVHGKHGSFSKNGLDPQEDALISGRRPGDRGWGIDPEPGTLTLADGEFRRTTRHAGEPGDYRRYYAGVRDAILGIGPNPVPASEALAVMRLLALGAESAARRIEIPLTDPSRAASAHSPP
jgi:predicted dehydrogenase